MTLLANALPKSVTFSVPLLPPSVNHYNIGGRFRTKETKAFIDAVCYLVPSRGVVPGDFYEVEITIHIDEAAFLRSDLDNFQKVAIDALKHAGCIRDDRYIVKLALEKQPCKGRAMERTWPEGVQRRIQIRERRDFESLYFDHQATLRSGAGVGLRSVRRAISEALSAPSLEGEPWP